MSDYIDIRGIRKEAVSMLKSSSSIDKTMKNTMKLGSLHSIYDSSQSLIGLDNEDSFYSSIYKPQSNNLNTQENKNKNRSLYSIDIKTFDQNSLKKLQSESIKQIKDDIFDKLCFNVFKMFSKYSSDQPLDNEELIIELSNIKEAIQIITETLETVPSRNMNTKLYFQNVEKSITFSRFKEYISIIFNQLINKSSQSNNKSNKNSTNVKSFSKSEFRNYSDGNLLQSANKSFTQNEFASSNLDPLPSIISLQGKEVQTKYLKDSLIESFRHDRIQVSSPTAKPNMLFSDDSTIGSNYASKSQINTLNTNSNLLNAKISKQVYNLMNPKENDNNKWKLMKIKRNERLEREELLKIRKDMLSNYKRISIDADRNEFHQVYQNQHIHNMNNIKKKHDDINNQQMKLKNNILKYKEDNIHKKREEIKYMKHILNDAMMQSRNMKEDEIMLAKMNVKDNQQQNNPFGLLQSDYDSKYLSSIVNIPIDFKNKMQNAKSLIEYNKAKQDIKDYYEKTMSNRITKYTIAKDIAIHRTNEELLEHHIQKTPILGSLYFQEASIHIPVVSSSNNSTASTINSIYKLDDYFISTTTPVLPAITPIMLNKSSIAMNTSFRSINSSSSMNDTNLSNNNDNLNTLYIDGNTTTTTNNNNNSTHTSENLIDHRPNTREMAIEAYLQQVQTYSEDISQ